MTPIKKGISLTALIGLLAITGCGATSTSLGAGNSAVPTETPIATKTPTSTSGEGTMTPGTVTLLSSKNHYATHDHIDLTVMNGLTTSFTVADHQSFCSIVTLQYRTASGEWQTVGKCLLMTPTRMIELAPHSTTPVHLPAPSGGWTPGSYQALLRGVPASTTAPISIAFTIQ